MGVSLERVQNKFACIIGELCSEPVVLSQFAIWLDLRLAEYKAKGAISLDCSGDDPDPTWMNAHRLRQQRIAERERTLGRGIGRNSLSQKVGSPTMPSPRYHSSGSSEAGRTVTDPSELVQGFGENRLSPVLVLIKEEPSDSVGQSGIFPVSLVHNEIRSQGRKRSAAETVSSEPDVLESDNNFFHQESPSAMSLPKVRRVASTSGGETPPTAVDSSNQSLMSIISGDMQSEQNNESRVNILDSDISIIMDYEDKHSVSQQRGDNSSAASTSFSGADESVSQDASNAVPEHSTSGYDWGEMRRNVVDLDEYSPTNINPTWLRNRAIRARIINIEEKSGASIRNIVNAVGILERWLWNKHGEERWMENIPPVELDAHLTNFFPVLKKPRGGDYDPDSLIKLRSYLDRFLREHNYPCSISKSKEFAQSQRVFHIMRTNIAMKLRTSNMD